MTRADGSVGAGVVRRSLRAWRTVTWLCAILCLALGARAADPLVKSVKVTQRPGTRTADIQYEVLDPEGRRMAVEFSGRDHEHDRVVPVTALTGETGSGARGELVETGTHTMEWDLVEDWGGNYTPDFALTVTVEALAEFVLIEAGTNSGTDPDFGAYTLTVEDLVMGTTEVTGALWDEVRDWALTNGYTDLSAGAYLGESHPVQSVTWYDVIKWCNARSEKERLTPCYYTTGGEVLRTGGDAEVVCRFGRSGYRLPTLEEWQYAARGGFSDRRFPWGDTITHREANYKSSDAYGYDISPTRGYHPEYDSEAPYTAPVGSFARNGYGFYDMAGNVFEWCWDWSDASKRVAAGGGAPWEAHLCRISSPGSLVPGDVRGHLGFRLCRTLNKPPVAVDDAYETLQETLLSVPAAGVLANDTDPNLDNLTATLVSDPSHGDLDLSADGSFTYTPETGFTGDDSFTYRVSDGELTSGTATVTLSVLCPVSFVLGDHGAFAEGGGALQQYVADGTGAVAPNLTVAEGWVFTGWDTAFDRVSGTMTITAQYASPWFADEFALIPAGTNAGTDPDFGAYSVTVETFYMAKNQVTKSEWDQVRAWAGDHGYTDLPEGGGKGADHPVLSVNWYDAVKWLNARSQMGGRTPCYTVSGAVYRAGEYDDVSCDLSANGYRLPTASERQYAARGGLRGSRFPWGDTITHDQANYRSSDSYSYDISPTRGYHPMYDDGSGVYTSPVGSFAANGYGLHDMAGNAWDWCWDWFPGYVGSHRWIRGGSWWHLADQLRAGQYRGGATGTRNNSSSFRACSGAPFAPVLHTVTFDPGDHGTRTGGGELEQTVEHGFAAVAPTVDAGEGWVFTGWDRTFDHVTGTTTVTARYASPWFADEFALIPAGTNAGTDPDYGVYSLTVNAVYMAETLVTKAKWEEVRVWGLSHGYPDLQPGLGKDIPGHPMYHASWYSAVKWLNARSEMDGRTPCYYTDNSLTTVYRSGSLDLADDCVKWDANGYRLSTYTEWVYAARGGLVGKRFPWGDTISHSNANYKSLEGISWDVSPTRGLHPDYDGFTSPVRAFAANGYGLHDMVGNMRQWCWDWGPGKVGTRRVFVGAEFGSDAWTCRVGNRGDFPPADGWFNLRACSIVPFEPVLHTVTFDPGDHGIRTGGGELEQTVEHGSGAVAPTLNVDEGWGLTGWDMAFNHVTGAMTVTAQYATRSFAEEFAYIPAGTNVGVDPTFGAYSLTSNALHMARTLVTKSRWQEVRAWGLANGYTDLEAGSGKDTEGQPVYGISWYGAAKWLNALSEMEGRVPCYYTDSSLTTVYRTGSLDLADDCVKWDADGYRLPTETEWEYAARGGRRNTRFAWGDIITHENANYISKADYAYDESETRGDHPDYQVGARPYTSPVRAFAPNGYGLHDVAGNMFEWCWNWHRSVSDQRAFRGGSATHDALFCLIGYSGAHPPENGWFNLRPCSLAPFSPVTHTVTFDPGEHGTRTGGGALEQTVPHGGGATAPTLSVDDGWEFTGWDTDFSHVTRDLTVTAQYAWAAFSQEFALVPGGENFGQDPDFGWYCLKVEPFYMARKHVTKAEWDEVRAWGADFGYTDIGAGGGKAPDHPVHTVSWYDTVKWLNARSEMEGRTPCYYTDAGHTTVYRTGSVDVEDAWVKGDASGYRLPTMAESEYAGRAGLAGKRFPWGDTISHSDANFLNGGGEDYASGTTGYHPDYDDDPSPYSSPGGAFPANGYGLYDMAGNMFVWCWDWHWTAVTTYRVFRGGSWGNDAAYCRQAAAFSPGAPPSASSAIVGLRVCSAVPFTPVYTVTFDLGEHGSRSGGGEAVQVVEHGLAAVAPEVTAADGWAFTGWDTGDTAFARVTGDLTVTAQYATPWFAEEFALIPAGTNSGDDPEWGPYSLTVDACLYMGRTEVTKSGWDEVRAWAVNHGYTDLPAGGGKAADHPVQTVSWYDVVKWLNARSEKEGRTPCYWTDAGQTTVYRTGAVNVEDDFVKWDANGYRLPTDTQWQYAARGGRAGLRFAWGDTITHDHANYNSRADDFYDVSETRGFHPAYAADPLPYTSPAGSFAANDYGLLDMAGNVAEWCWDWSPVEENSRIIRNGAFSGHAYTLSSGWRQQITPAWADNYCGFRVAKAAPFSPVLHTVTFDLGEHGSRSGGGEAVQVVEHGFAAAAPEVTAADGWAFTGWDTGDTAFARVTGDLTVTAQYATPWFADEFALIPAGTNAGTDPGFGAYSLSVDACLYMGRTEVTKSGWDEVRAWAVNHGYTDLPVGGGKAPDHPVQTVSWYDAVKWLNARSEMDGRTPCYWTDAAQTTVYRAGNLNLADDCVKGDADGYRLPTATEWQYAARGGRTGLRFGWGDTITHEQANYTSRADEPYDVSVTRGPHPVYGVDPLPYTAPAGSFAANDYGLLDMAGNAGEWCWDRSPTDESLRGWRGGAFNLPSYALRSGWKHEITPAWADNYCGFRVAQNAPFSPVFRTVTFDLGEHGERTGGGALEQVVEHGAGATAPTLDVDDGWSFDGWDVAFDTVTSDLTVTAEYSQTTPTRTYVVIDLSAGSSATSYPWTELDSIPAGGWTTDHKTTKLVLRRIPAGTFTMGSPGDPAPELGRGSDETQHSVTLTQDLYVGVFEVTQAQWNRVMGTWPSYFNNTTYRNTRPVETVSWNEIRGGAWPGDPAGSGAPGAGTFVKLLRDRTGLSVDLPTESQWEYACRAGTTTALNSGKNLTSTGECPNMAAVGRYYYNGYSGYTQGGDTSKGTAAAGSYQANAWGLYDMHGNVWEWCADWYGTYPGTVTDPLGSASGSNRVIRGGSWVNLAGNCRSAQRVRFSPTNRNIFIGFRLALPAGQP